MKGRLYEHLAFLYGRERAGFVSESLEALLAAYRPYLPDLPAVTLGPEDAVLITYGDMVQDGRRPPLLVLNNFLVAHLKNTISTVHILPFYPSSSDDGFSVVDYLAVEPELGSWDDIGRLGRHFRLMFDAVVNHISAESEWFRRFLAGDPAYREYFAVIDERTDVSAVFRPRALPLLTPVETATGKKLVWTTFSADQIDLNYANPQVLLAVIEVLLFYILKGAEFIRLDAIAFMWKEIGTSCLHLPQTHRIIQLWRSILDRVAPGVALITETNVPHQENISYFGDGSNEAQMVYNFSLPPLTLHAFMTGNAETLSAWAETLELPSKQVTFFNFLASHDGIGLTPLKGVLPESEVAAIVERVKQLGGLVSYRNNPDGSRSVYELNINYLDALGDPEQPDEDVNLVAQRFLAAQAIMLALKGVPGIYFHSMFGSRGWPEGRQMTGRNRTVNRQKLAVDVLEDELATPGSLRRLIYDGYRHLLQVRAGSAAFHPYGEQEIYRLHPAVFVVRRTAPDGEESVLCLQNVSSLQARVDLAEGEYTDLLSGRSLIGGTVVALEPYRVMWLRKDTGRAGGSGSDGIG